MIHRPAMAALAALLAGSALLAPSAQAATDRATAHTTTDESTADRAAPGPRLPDVWPAPQICTEAAFTDHSAVRSGHAITITLGGWIRPCPGENDPGAARSFTFYYPPGIPAQSRTFWPIFDPESQTYTFEVTGRVHELIHAICIIDGMIAIAPNRAKASRRACLEIQATATGAVITPIPTTDPGVLTSIAIRPDFRPGPYCSSCL